jgi:hypothetical protein
MRRLEARTALGSIEGDSGGRRRELAEGEAAGGHSGVEVKRSFRFPSTTKERLLELKSPRNPEITSTGIHLRHAPSRRITNHGSSYFRGLIWLEMGIAIRLYVSSVGPFHYDLILAIYLD